VTSCEQLLCSNLFFRERSSVEFNEFDLFEKLISHDRLETDENGELHRQRNGPHSPRASFIIAVNNVLIKI